MNSIRSWFSGVQSALVLGVTAGAFGASRESLPSDLDLALARSCMC
jgi:hypothetical protein